jgi:hypothetical protein
MPGEYLSRLRIQSDIRPVNLGIAGMSETFLPHSGHLISAICRSPNGVGRKLVTDEIRKWDALPTAMTQQIMGNGHRFDTTIEGR